MSVQSTGIVYNAAAMSRILGLPCECSDPVPEAGDDGIVIYYGGWDLPELRDSTAGKRCMNQNIYWFEKCGWKAKPGYYRVNLRVRGSERKSWSEKIAHLRATNKAAQPAPVAVAATTLLAHLMDTGGDLLKSCERRHPGVIYTHGGGSITLGPLLLERLDKRHSWEGYNWCCCAGLSIDMADYSDMKSGLAFTIKDGRVDAGYLGDIASDDNVWLASSEFLSPAA